MLAFILTSVSGLFFCLVILFVLLIVFLVIKKRNSTGIAQTETPTIGVNQQNIVFRQKREHFQEERERILSMVESGKISPEEAERLLNTLERETKTKACPFCSEEIQVEAVKCRHCKHWLTDDFIRSKRLMRSRNRILAGVCGGLAEYLEIDPTIIRISTVLLAFFSVTTLLVYLIAALIIPNQK